MRYLIDAWLEGGVPQLRLRDAETGAVRLRWSHAGSCEAEGGEEHARATRRAFQRLFKELVLLSCASNLALTERAEDPGFGAECLGCGGCASGDGGSAAKDPARADRVGKVMYLQDRRRAGEPDGQG